MIASFVAAIGLIATAWTSFYQVQTSKDQLAQSAEDSEKELQSQAALVSSWTQIGKDGQTTGYFANRSLDPISQVTIGVASGNDLEVQEGLYRGEKDLLDLSDVPPCSLVTIPNSVIGRKQYFAIAGFSFVDVRGQRWGRDRYKPLKAMNLAPAITTRSLTQHRVMDTWKLLFGSSGPPAMASARPGSVFSDIPAPKPLKDCGSDSK
ncbi:hypothetical protein [Streptomyces sp. NPDC003697]